MSRNPVDIKGQRFGRLVALECMGVLPYYADHHAMWKCRCDCGNEVIIKGCDLRRGISRSCGCLRRDMLRNRGKKHENA